MRENEVLLTNNQIHYFLDICNDFKENKQWLMCINEAIKDSEQNSKYVYDNKYGVVRPIEETIMQKRVIDANVKKVEKVLEDIKIFYGKEGYEIAWKLFVEKKSVQEISNLYCLNRKELERKINDWLNGVLCC